MYICVYIYVYMYICIYPRSHFVFLCFVFVFFLCPHVVGVGAVIRPTSPLSAVLLSATWPGPFSHTPFGLFWFCCQLSIAICGDFRKMATKDF